MRQPKPYWRKQKACWAVDLDGRRISLGKDEKAAWEKYHRLMAERWERPTEDSVWHVFELYYDWLESNRAPSTARRRLELLRSFGDFVGPQKKVHQVKAADVLRWLKKCYPRASDGYRNTLITNLKAAFNWCEKHDVITRNPIARMERPAQGVRQEFVRAEDWPKMLAAADGPFSDLLEIALLTGARAQELFIAEAAHFDRAHSRLVFPIGKSKGRKRSRVVYLPPRAVEIISRRCEEFPSGPIFRNTRGEPWSKNSIKCAFQRLRKKLGWKQLNLTMLRHSWCHQRLISGTDPVLVATLMGHSDLSMITKRYGHLSEGVEYLKQAVSEINF